MYHYIWFLYYRPHPPDLIRELSSGGDLHMHTLPKNMVADMFDPLNCMSFSPILILYEQFQSPEYTCTRTPVSQCVPKLRRVLI